jgi:general L-amino acid transport system permease protein
LLCIVAVVVLIVITLVGPRQGGWRRAIPLLWSGMAPLGLWLLAGGLGLAPVGTQSWGGFSLTLLLTAGSGMLALPLGVLLALGRRSDLPVLRGSSTAYIELMRAVPLIAVLFFGQLLIPLFLPPGVEINRVLRAVVAFALFAAAYIAEDVRGGLQAIPPTQREAAMVLGLSPRQTLQLVVLPQAFRVALPSLTNQAVGLLQNTSLMAILGLVELLGISRSLLANPAFIGRYLEVYIWLAAVYWLACTAMALLARHLEIQLDPVRSAR